MSKMLWAKFIFVCVVLLAMPLGLGAWAWIDVINGKATVGQVLIISAFVFLYFYALGIAITSEEMK